MDRNTCYSWGSIQHHYKDSRVRRGVRITDVLNTYEGVVHFDGLDVTCRVYPMVGNIIGTDSVRANYGTIRVMQSCFLASHRSSGTARIASKSTKSCASSASKGGSKVLGEMEVTQLVGSGLSHCLQELSDRSDVHVVSVCTTLYM